MFEIVVHEYGPTDKTRPFSFRLLEEAQFAGKWIVCMASRETAEWLNYVRFLLEKSSKGAKEEASSPHDSFRVWILCSSLSSYLSLTPLSVPSNCVAVDELRTVRRLWEIIFCGATAIFSMTSRISIELEGKEMEDKQNKE